MFGKGFLGDIGTRLQRLLKFDGSADASFDSKAIPVMLVGDATLPGYGDQQGRNFGVLSTVVLNSWFYIRANADVIIGRVDIQTTAPAAGAACSFSLVPPGTADPGSVPGGIFLDRNASANDRPPLGVVTNATPTAGTVLQNLFTSAAAIPGTTWVFDRPFCLGAGQAIVFTATGGSWNVCVWGQTL